MTDGDEADVWLNNEKWRRAKKADADSRRSFSGIISEPNFDAFVKQVVSNEEQSERQALLAKQSHREGSKKHGSQVNIVANTTHLHACITEGVCS